MTNDSTDIRLQLGLRPVINVSGTMTALGASIVVPQAIQAVSEILPHFVEIHDLQRKASAVIARLTGAEAGCVTASASAGITIAVAGAMTGPDLARVEQLPDTTGMNDEVVIQAGHMVHYGAPVEQAIRLAGGKVVMVGTATDARPHQLAGKITERTAAAVYVVSHHAVGYGQIPLHEFAHICHEHGVPVIADLASEYDLRGFLEQGADVAIYSAHKFLGGPTAGIVAGSRELIRAAYFQNYGIGRGMKVGKEGIVGAMAALEAWEHRDHVAVRKLETSYLTLWQDRFAGLPGITATLEPDPTNNPLDRLKFAVNPAEAKITAWELADRLAAGDPPIIVRAHEIEHGFFYLDPCNLHPGQAEIVADRICQELQKALEENRQEHEDLTRLRARKFEKTLAWPE
ncbi:aminotransferase class V-fold PLP-dependent enzyme [candidate division KSB3 bacterium]|uniref:Aminotransferase class V-fold PLP-dependent enzyme n=1 Tax=candidate division KSB3 bacterium TaxID=2044937 RepID=A0A9D5Q5T4_9BACT|nr:aminotransferase class V-fold PLP-dependent enzyme [candidate division KSB3 bacterium]MBD3324196.1 aminotransferase class V-fold PLP-dependent enzyme [candidate division KSB3 bacterium]